MQPLTWNQLLADFDTHQRAAGRSPGTIRLYRYRIQILAETVRRPDDVTADLLLNLMGNPTWKPETRRSVRSAYCTFFAWAVKSGRLESNPADQLPSVRVVAGPPRPTPELVVRESLRQAEPREAFMVMLGAYAGLRCLEIARVHRDHWDGQTLTVLGKGRKTRLVPIVQADLVQLLNDLQGAAFPNRWTGEPLTPGCVSKLLSRALSETWTGHTLRHRFGTRALAGTKDLLAVGKVMGHSRPETTQRYCEVADDRLRAVAVAAA